MNICGELHVTKFKNKNIHMKRNMFTLLLVVGFVTMASAQAYEGTIQYNKKKQQAVMIDYGFTPEAVENAFVQKMAKLGYKPKEEKGILNNVQLHFQNEPARHKLLDIIGDFALVGMPFQGHILAARPGHAANVEFAKVIKEVIKRDRNQKVRTYDLTATPIYDINKITKMLPHRIPFLLIDKIMELEADRVVGVKNVTMNEWFFQGH